MSDLPLNNRIALVTGASRGIGKAAALALAQAGAHVVAVARTQGALEALDDEIRALTGQSATLVPMDIGEPDGLDQLGLAIHERFGRLDIPVPRPPGRGGRPKAFWGVYGATKAGMEHIVRTWADELEQTSIRAVLLDPGAMRTRMRAEAMPGENPAHLPDPSEIGPLIVELAQADLGLPTANVVFSDWKTAGKLASA